MLTVITNARLGENESMSTDSKYRYLNELLLSLNLSCFCMGLIFLWGPPSLVSALFRMDTSVQGAIGIHVADVQLGYLAFFLPALAIAACIWLTVELNSGTTFGKESLRSIAGVAAIALPPVYWLFGTFAHGGRSPLFGAPPYELILAIGLLFLYLRFPHQTSWLLVVLAVVLHYTFWFSQFGPYSLFLGRGGPLFSLPLIGFSSALAWSIYMRNLNATQN